MKFLSFLIIILLASITLFSQEKASGSLLFGGQSKSTFSSSRSVTLYEFTLDSAAYNFLTDSISLNNGEVWDDPEYFIDLDFPLYIYDSLTPYMAIDDLGNGLSTYYLDVDKELVHGLAPFSADGIDRGTLSGTSLSPLSFKVIGEMGSRILIVEWRNIGSYEELDALGTLSMFMNYQVWLYEGSNTIEYRYGPSMIDEPEVFYYMEPGPFVGMAAIEYFDLIYYALQTLEGPASNPTLVNHNDDSNIYPLTGTPPDGHIYRFGPISTSIQSPTPEKPIVLIAGADHATLALNMDGYSAPVTIYDMQGRTVWSDRNYMPLTPISVQQFMAGMYVIHVETPGGVQLLKFIRS